MCVHIFYFFCVPIFLGVHISVLLLSLFLLTLDRVQIFYSKYIFMNRARKWGRARKKERRGKKERARERGKTSYDNDCGRIFIQFSMAYFIWNGNVMLDLRCVEGGNVGS